MGKLGRWRSSTGRCGHGRKDGVRDGGRRRKRIKEGKRKRRGEGPETRRKGSFREVEGQICKTKKRREGGCKVQGVGKENCQGETLGFGG